MRVIQSHNPRTGIYHHQLRAALQRVEAGVQILRMTALESPKCLKQI
jgi:hypothetical protein